MNDYGIYMRYGDHLCKVVSLRDVPFNNYIYMEKLACLLVGESQNSFNT
jgi:hypothetical protein